MPKDKKIKSKKEKEINFLDNIASEVALHYGFTALSNIQITKEDRSKIKLLGDYEERSSPKPIISAEEKIALIRNYYENSLDKESQPIMFFSQKEFNDKKGKSMAFNLDIIGTGKSISEAILIETTIAILQEEKYDNLQIKVNTVGDRECLNRFGKELSNYYRKYINNISSTCRQSMKENIFDVLSCEYEQCQKINEEAPKSISFLNEESQRHFKEILEYLESLGIPYQVDNKIVGNSLISTETVFSIYGSKGNKDIKLLAIGSRYNNLAKRIGNKRDLPSAGVSMYYLPEKQKKNSKLKNKKAKIFFIQLGFEAKLKCLKVMEILRQANIPVYQSLSKDKISAQIAFAEKMKTPYTIIMGQKEAIENSIIVRDNSTRSQESVPLNVLPQYLKKLK